MKNKKTKVLLILFIMLLLTGCTKTLKTSDNKVVKYDVDTVCSICNDNITTLENNLSQLTEGTEEYLNLQTKITEEKNKCTLKCEEVKNTATGQNLTENILCKPTNEDVIAIYEANGVDIDALPSCNDFTIFSNYESLWISFFVKPLAWLLIKGGILLKNEGLSLVIITLLIRLLLMPFTKKTAMQSENLKKAQPEIDLINKKYENKANDAEAQTKKAQETMLIYKKYDINPLSSCLFAFIQIPLLFAFIEAINRTPSIFEGTFLGLNLGLTPWQALSTGKWWYLIIVIILGLVTHFSLKLNKTASAPGNDTEKQMDMMNKFMLIFIIYASLSMSTAICIYWITSSTFTIYQNLIVKKKVN